ncbi:PREDICTED: protein SIEL isoform X2 [Nelumbo nucifera]|nr:PREDICTED: protein SIEL isoform X2 [Nelumbo nucifera]
MNMEEHVWGKYEQYIALHTAQPANTRRHYVQALASARALILNPSTSDHTISCILETLVRSLQYEPDPLLLHHVLKLLSDIALHHRHLSFSIFNTIRAHEAGHKDSNGLAVEVLSVLFTIAEHDHSLATAMYDLDENFVLSLFLSPVTTRRSWLLTNISRFHIKQSFLITLFLAFMKDPYPFVRSSALVGLLGLSKSVDGKEYAVVKECYGCAMELLHDIDERVRSAAVRVISDWGQVLVAPNDEANKRDWYDVIFVQLCSMVRDMSVEVRIEAFVALGKLELVSEELLLQSLSKKTLAVIKEKKIFFQCHEKELELSKSSAAGAFVHGLEDEFYEVRRSACNSLGMLSIFSLQFASDALDLLVDLLNDDSTVVRLQALETMYHMAKCGCLRVQETHMHMLLGTLVDTSSLIRSAARKIFRIMKLSVRAMFASIISGLLSNLRTYPQDEADIFPLLFDIGRNHGNFVVSFIKEVIQEMEPSCEGELRFDSANVAALLVLAISVPLSHEHSACNIPLRIFSYGLPFLGRISRSLSDSTNRDAILAYLFHCSGSILPLVTELNFRGNELVLPVAEGGGPSHSDHEGANPLEVFLQQISNCGNSSDAQSMYVPSHASTEFEEWVTVSVKRIFKVVAETWPYIQSGCTTEVLRTLRNCKEELATITTNSLGSFDVLAFTSQYLQVIQLLAKIWEHFLPKKMFQFYGVGRLDLLLEKLESGLSGLRHKFSGLSIEEEFHVLELILLTCVLRLCKVEICCHLITLNRLYTTMSSIELLCGKGTLEPSNFVKELQKLLLQLGPLGDGASYDPLSFKRLLEFFSLKQVVYNGRFKHMKAELDIPSNDSENPLHFVSGLPVGIPFQISLYNISLEDKLWIMMAVENSIQYAFLDLEQFGGCDEVRTVTLSVPFYRTPNVVSFSLRATVGREYTSHDVHLVKG